MSAKGERVFADPDMTLEEWKKVVDHLIELYGLGSYMYIDAGRNNAQLMVSDEPPNIGTGRPD